MKTATTIFFFIIWILLINVIVESEGDGLTNAEWLAGVVVTFGLLFGLGYALKDMD
ncbi:MAG: hypothetical protein WD511_00775 [Balneolaceae bacterium]